MWSGWRQADAARRQVRRALPDLKGVHLPDMKDLHLPDLHAPEIDWARGRMGSRAATLWPALFAAAGAGAAVWWWNQWARGRAEADAEATREAGAVRPELERSAEDRAGGAEGAAAPEAIMAHGPAPEPAKPRKLEAAARDGAMSAQAGEALDQSLGVQGAAPRKPKKAVAKSQ